MLDFPNYVNDIFIGLEYMGQLVTKVYPELFTLKKLSQKY